MNPDRPIRDRPDKFAADDLGVTVNTDLPCCDDTSPDCPDDDIPPRALETILDAGAELAQAAADVEALLDELFGEVSQALDGLTALVNSMCDEIIGGLDVELSAWETKAIKVVMAIVTGADREIEQCVLWLQSAGIQPPWHPAEYTAAIEGEWVSMLVNAIPAFGRHLGIMPTTPVDSSSFVEGDQSYVGGDGAITGDYVLGANTTNYAGAGTGGNPVSAVPGPVPQTSGPITVSAPLGADRGDVYVTVNVPPPVPVPAQIVVQPAGASPQDTPPLPPPPPDRGGYPPLPGSPGGAPIPPYIGAAPPQSFGPGPTSMSPNQPPPVAPSVLFPSRPPLVPGIPSGTSAPGALTHLGQSSAEASWAGVMAAAYQPRADGSHIDAVNWNDPAACAHATSLAQAPAQNLAPPEKGEKKSAVEYYLEGKLQWQNWIGVAAFPLFIPLELKQMADAWAKSEQGKDASADAAVGMLAQQSVLGNIGPNAVPNRAAATFFGGKIAAARFAESKTYFPLDYLMTSDLYLFQHSNPQYLPNQIRTDDAYLAGQIPIEQWSCWTRANGNLPDPARRVMLGQQARPGINELLTLWRRGHMTQESLFKRMREKGVLDENYTREFQAVTVALPTQSDLIQFMVRDASDDEVSKLYGYDTDFERKFTPQMERWAKALGLDPTYFRYIWRSHWHIPSYTQLREMFHRFRPDRPEVVAWDEMEKNLGAGATELALGPRPSVCTREDFRQALMIDDVAPGWVDRMIDAAYVPINRTDAVRAYTIGAFTADRLRDAFLDIGYSPESSDTLVKFHSQDKARKRAFVTGSWSARKIGTYYKKGYINRAKAEELMSPLMADQWEVGRTLDMADDEMAADTRASAVKGVRRGLIAGEHSNREARDLLIKFGVSQTQADSLVTSWAIERDTRYKRVSIKQATEMLEAGLISPDELKRRARNLGYVARDADLIVAKALGIEGGADGIPEGELPEVLGEAIASRKQAGMRNDSQLGRRLHQIWSEATRITKELNRRREGRSEPMLPLPVAPP